MGTIGTFDSFTAARLGLYAAQHGLRVTGNNISNLNTEGYTRQRIDQVSLKTGASDMYRSLYDNHVGNGALVTGINQIRDPYLDIRFRNNNADVGYYETTLNGLNDIAAILDEVGKGENDGDGLLYAQLVDLASSLRALEQDPNADNDTLARSSAKNLVSLFNTYADKLETLRQNTIASFEQDVTSVNEILTKIRELNESIRTSDIHGDSALEMRDERNRQIDKLSEYMKINVVYSMEDIGAGQQVEKLTISLGNANPDTSVTTDSTTLIDGIYGAQISIIQVPTPNPDYDPDDPDSLPYLDDFGQPVETEDEAALMNNPNFDLHISKMYDSKGHQWRETSTTCEAVAAEGTDAGITKADDGSSRTEISYAQVNGKWFKVTTVTNYSQEVDLDDNDLYGSLQATRELLTEAGEFTSQDTVDNIDENALIKRGIPYYQKSLDLLALQLATQFNNLNQGFMVNQDGNYIDSNGQVLELAGQPINKADGLTDDQKQALIDGGCVLDDGTPDLNRWLEAKDALVPEGGGVLFSNKNDGDLTEGITAATISISNSWSIGDVKVVPTFTQLFGEDGKPLTNSTQGDNVGHMLALMDADLVYDPKDLVPDAAGSKLFTGCFNDMFNNMMTVQGNDSRIKGTSYLTHYGSMVELDTSRDSVSGVELNDETMNMMMYQKAYSAACRLMTTIDEMLDRLINYTAV